MNNAAATNVKSAERVLDVLELLARRARELSHAEIAAALAIPKSSLTQLLRTLVARHYLRFNPAAKSYSLDDAAFALGRSASHGFDFARIARPVLERLTAATDESSALNVLRDNTIEVVCGVNSSLPLLYTMRIGDRAPLYATSGGKAILAHLPRAWRDAYFGSARFEPITARTVRSAAKLQAELATVIRRGIAYSKEEFTPGIIGVGIPVLDATGYPVAAINVAIPAVRFSRVSRARVAAALREAAASLSRELDGADRRIDGAPAAGAAR